MSPVGLSIHKITNNVKKNRIYNGTSDSRCKLLDQASAQTTEVACSLHTKRRTPRTTKRTNIGALCLKQASEKWNTSAAAAGLNQDGVADFEKKTVRKNNQNNFEEYNKKQLTSTLLLTGVYFRAAGFSDVSAY